MARDFFQATVTLPDATGTVKALSGIKVSVVPRGSSDVANTLVDIYTADTGSVRGPDPKAAATGTHPFTTGVTGSVRFWAEGPAEYDVVYEDLTVPARITDRVGWNCLPAKAGSFSTKVLAADAGITQKMLSAEAIYQQVPIGGVIDWWRPSPAIGVPIGFEIADGRSITQHEFPNVTGSVVLPNLQNAFILGVSTNKTDGSGADQGNAANQGPGLGGTGGSNAARNLAHSHGVPGVNHQHDGSPLYTGGHSHSVSVSGSTSEPNISVANPYATGSVALPNWHHTHTFSGSGGTSGAGNLGIGGNTNWADRVLDTGTNSTTWVAGDAAVNEMRPRFIGLLKLIKVRRTA